MRLDNYEVEISRMSSRSLLGNNNNNKFLRSFDVSRAINRSNVNETSLTTPM